MKKERKTNRGYKMFKTFLVLTGFLFTVGGVYAQQTADVDISGRLQILEPLTIDCTGTGTVLEFGQIAKGDTTLSAIDTSLGHFGGATYSVPDPAGVVCIVEGEDDAHVSVDDGCPRTAGATWPDIGTVTYAYPQAFITIGEAPVGFSAVPGEYSFKVDGLLTLIPGVPDAALGLHDTDLPVCTIVLAYM
jgi:hypothetical protein